MNKRLTAVTLFFLISISSFSQVSLETIIKPLRNNKGNIMFQLFDENEKIVEERQSKIHDNACILTFNGLKPGIYAVRFYHDENINGKLETNLAGKPTEGYGFSNNVKGLFGPPPFRKWLFRLNRDTSITLKPIY